MKVQPLICASLFVLMLASPRDIGAAGPTKISVGFWGPSDISECDSTHGSVYFVGGTYDVTVTLLPDGMRPGDVPYKAIAEWDSPQGIELEAAASPEFEDLRTYSKGLAQQLDFQYYVTMSQALTDSIWTAMGQSPPPGLTAPEYHFAFRVPTGLAGQFLWVRATWHHPQYGMLTGEVRVGIRIASVCSERAQYAVWRTNVQAACDKRDYTLAVALADSFVGSGWRDWAGLIVAEGAAIRSGRYEDAIRFLDMYYETYHTIAPPQAASSSPEIRQANYERARARLIARSDEQH